MYGLLILAVNQLKVKKKEEEEKSLLAIFVTQILSRRYRATRLPATIIMPVASSLALYRKGILYLFS